MEGGGTPSMPNSHDANGGALRLATPLPASIAPKSILSGGDCRFEKILALKRDN